MLRRSKYASRKFDNLTEFLFAEDIEDDEVSGYLPIEVDIKDIERVHHVYISSLISIYEKLRIIYSRYLNMYPPSVIQSLKSNEENRFTLEAP